MVRAKTDKLCITPITKLIHDSLIEETFLD